MIEQFAEWADENHPVRVLEDALDEGLQGQWRWYRADPAPAEFERLPMCRAARWIILEGEDGGQRGGQPSERHYYSVDLSRELQSYVFTHSVVSRGPKAVYAWLLQPSVVIAFFALSWPGAPTLSSIISSLVARHPPNFFGLT